jgi:putative methyltransferase (TIGR04325 family)
MSEQASAPARGIERWGRVPLLGSWARGRYERYFDNATGLQLFRGKFDSFEAAQASAPPTKPLSYDNDASAELYLQRLRADAHDYPALFWLAQSFADGMRTVFDLGGSVGIKYFAFSRLTPFPPDAFWKVQDMPAVVERGRLFAIERQVQHRLSFTHEFAEGDGSDLLFTSGALQYLPKRLDELLRTWARLPRRIIVNTTAIHPTESFFTLNNIGTAFCPYRVRAHGAFVKEVSECGFKLRDHWQNPAKFMRIPFEQGLDLDTYSGYCFDRA